MWVDIWYIYTGKPCEGLEKTWFPAIVPSNQCSFGWPKLAHIRRYVSPGFQTESVIPTYCHTVLHDTMLKFHLSCWASQPLVRSHQMLEIDILCMKKHCLGVAGRFMTSSWAGRSMSMLVQHGWRFRAFHDGFSRRLATAALCGRALHNYFLQEGICTSSSEKFNPDFPQASLLISLSSSTSKSECHRYTSPSFDKL